MFEPGSDKIATENKFKNKNNKNVAHKKVQVSYTQLSIQEAESQKVFLMDMGS